MGKTKQLMEELQATDEYNELIWYTLESESEY
jgi:hypothetical protein